MNQYLIAVTDLSEAIAAAEGFGIEGTVPTRAHNPGDLKLTGYPTIGKEEVSVFDSDEVGWIYLHNQIERIRTGRSHIYWLAMTFEDFAFRWTDSQQNAWMNNVISKLRKLGYLEVNKNTTLSEYFNMRKE